MKSINTLCKIISLVALLSTSQAALAQYAHFLKSGVIEFEKRVNMYGRIRSQMGEHAFLAEAVDQYRKSNPQFKTFTYQLAFSDNKTRYWPDLKSDAAPRGVFGHDPTLDIGNTIVTTLSDGLQISQKSIFENTYLITDSTRRIQWRLTNETRDIAGYLCRRANAIVLDSVYVVAFYTDQVPVSGGPESFTGLPGMILGIALPHENTTYFATKVVERPVSANELEAPKKGKATNYQKLREELMNSLGAWGDHAHTILKAVFL